MVHVIKLIDQGSVGDSHFGFQKEDPSFNSEQAHKHKGSVRLLSEFYLRLTYNAYATSNLEFGLEW
jgi:hypothetical protein